MATASSGREAVGSERDRDALLLSAPFDLCVVDEAHEVFAGIYKRFDKNGIYQEESPHARTTGRQPREARRGEVCARAARPPPAQVGPIVGQSLTRCLQVIEVIPLNPQIQVIYLHPLADHGPNCLGFKQFAAYVSQFSDPFSQRFAKHLRAWREAAGAMLLAAVRDRAGVSWRST